LARTGSISGNSSGDLFVAFSTANPQAARADRIPGLAMIPNERLDPLFTATVEATEEAVINALIAADTMVGRDGHKAVALPHERIQAILKKYGRLRYAAANQ
jgi:L-aminopeptidase/D-esterase-like protein